MTLRPVDNPAAGLAQRTRTGRHFSGMTRRDLGDQEKKLSKLQLGKQNSESVSLLVRVGEGRKSPGSVSRGGRFINEDADRKRL